MNRQESVGQRRGDVQEHSRSRSSCWLHCHSSRHCPYRSRDPRQRRLATCRPLALHREEAEGQDLGFTRVLYWSCEYHQESSLGKNPTGGEENWIQMWCSDRLLQNNSSKHKRHSDNHQTWDGALAEAKNTLQNCCFKTSEKQQLMSALSIRVTNDRHKSELMAKWSS